MLGLVRFLALFVLCMPMTTALADNIRLVIRLKDGLPAQSTSAQSTQARAFKPSQSFVLDELAVDKKLASLSQVHQTRFKRVRQYQSDGLVIMADSALQSRQLIQRLQSDPAVLSVDEDRPIRVRAQNPLVGLLNTLDLSLRPRFWIHRTTDVQPASINSESMWLRYHGSASAVVAVLDTGVLFNHPALQGHLLPGFDFVSDAFQGNDGQSTVAGSDRDSDPSDPGDGVGPTDLLNSSACAAVSDSSWHGTFTASLIAGNPNVSEGYFPTAWNALILPVRVLGRCGGFSSDLADGIRWAAGLDVPGVPPNPFPARILNLSLGAQGACSDSIEGAAVAAARAAGALVVAAAGNEGGAVDSPADCPGALGVAALDQQGFKANYSNFGPSVAIAAPGGDAAFPIWGASNAGLLGPGLATYRSKIGSSFASPLVASAAAQILALRPGSTVDQLQQDILGSARPFLSTLRGSSCGVGTTNSTCKCTSSTCGAGMLDVSRALFARGNVSTTNLFSNSGTVQTPGSTKVFSAEGSTNAALSVEKSVTFSINNVVNASGSTARPSLSVAGLEASVTVPSGVLGYEITAVGSSGASTQALVAVADGQTVAPSLVFAILDPLLSGAAISNTGAITAPSTSGPSAGGQSAGSPVGGASGSGGGGGVGVWGLCMLFLLFLVYKCSLFTPRQRGG